MRPFECGGLGSSLASSSLFIFGFSKGPFYRAVFFGVVLMPLFVFKCESCGNVQEKLQKFSDTPPVCESCDDKFPDETPFMERQIGLTTFTLKGEGWARDNYGLK